MYRILTNRLFSLVCITALAASITACGSIQAVPSSERDSSGKFDGSWIGTFQRTPSVQYAYVEDQRWTLNCHNYKGRVIGIYIKDGVVSYRSGPDDKIHEANISKNGKFRLEVPTDDTAGVTTRSDSTLGKDAITLILLGKMGSATPKARFVIGVKEFFNHGCSTTIVFKRGSGSEQAA